MRDRLARYALRTCHWQALWVTDLVYVFIFWFPFDCSVTARRKQLCDGTDLVQNQYSLYEIV